MRNGAQYRAELLVYRYYTPIGRDSNVHGRD